MTDRYTYQVTWSSEDDEYVGLCAEFPSLSWLAATPDEAFSGIREIVADCIADMHSTGETPPEPKPTALVLGALTIGVNFDSEDGSCYGRLNLELNRHWVLTI